MFIFLVFGVFLRGVREFTVNFSDKKIEGELYFFFNNILLRINYLFVSILGIVEIGRF